MNKYHRYLKLPFEVNPPKMFEEHGPIIQHHYINDYQCSDMDDFFKTFGLTCHLKECFYTPPNSKIPIHTDHASYTDHTKINITWGPEEGVIQWWKSDIVREYQFVGGEYTKEKHHNLWANEEDCELLYEANTNRPSLVNVGVLHGTNNPTNFGRWTVCFVPATPEREYLNWYRALEIFKDYIEE